LDFDLAFEKKGSRLFLSKSRDFRMKVSRRRGRRDLRNEQGNNTTWKNVGKKIWSNIGKGILTLAGPHRVRYCAYWSRGRGLIGLALVPPPDVYIEPVVPFIAHSFLVHWTNF